MVTLLILLAVVIATALLAVGLVLLRRNRGADGAAEVDRAELQARQAALRQARRPEHGYGADRTYGGGGPF